MKKSSFLCFLSSFHTDLNYPAVQIWWSVSVHYIQNKRESLNDTDATNQMFQWREAGWNEMCMLAVVVIISNNIFLALKQTTKKKLLCFAIKRSFSNDRSYPVFCILIVVMCFLGCYRMHLRVCVRVCGCTVCLWLRKCMSVQFCPANTANTQKNNCEYSVHLKIMFISWHHCSVFKLCIEKKIQ